MLKMFRPIARYIKQLRADRAWEKRRHQSSYRATALAVKLVITGALTPSTRPSNIYRRQP